MVQNDAKTPIGENNTNNSDEKNLNMASLLEKEGLGIDLPKAGEIRTGTIASISPGQILISVGAKSEGLISGREFELIPPEEFANLEVGQELPVYVITVEDSNGNLLLSYVRAVEESSWDKAEEVFKNKKTYQGKVAGYNKGGLLVAFEKLRGFIPSSQLSYERLKEAAGNTPEERYGKMIGSDIDVSVIEVDRERHRLILSERLACGETRDAIREKVISDLEIGSVLTGKITSVANFGVFVNVNGADGLVHISELSWDEISDPSEKFKVGQSVKVKVISIDEDKKRIGLSIRQLEEDPWMKKVENLRVGMLVEATITNLTKFGAFAKIQDDIEGLVHISEISESHITHPKEVLHDGEKVTLRIIKIEPESHRIGLSLRRVESAAYADMDMKLLKQELENSDIHVNFSGNEKADDEDAAQTAE
ncbi:MAG: S1 RNA-binding domain-containing protein [Anaerolineaceae bacterium]|jgi:small subunit ribosomal protein S1|nr:MAG: S1 RNA-binding domain-containing protein [Anaerolineaceae bacterium]